MAEKEIKYEIVKRLGYLGEQVNGEWVKEVNMIKWNGAKEAKFDFRPWKRDDFENPQPTDRMGKGITLSDDEAGMLMEILNDNY